MKTMMKLFCGAAFAMALGAGAAEAQVLFWSTQAKPVEETQKMRDQVLSGFEGGVDYQPQDDGPWLTRVQAELQAGSGTIGVLGALHGSFSSLAADLVDLSDVDLGAGPWLALAASVGLIRRVSGAGGRSSMTVTSISAISRAHCLIEASKVVRPGGA